MANVEPQKLHLFGHQAFGLKPPWDLHVLLRKRRAPLSRNATLTIGTDDGLQQFHIRDRNVFATR